jgi:hypothetical protein
MSTGFSRFRVFAFSRFCDFARLRTF